MKFKDTEYGNLTGKIYTTNINLVNKSLSSFDGSPEKINGDFDCGHNELTSLKDCPKKINGIFNCSYNSKLLTPLKQIIENQIKAKRYITDDGRYSFDFIKKEFIEYGRYLLKQEKIKEKLLNKNKVINNTKKLFNNKDFGLSF